MNPTARIIDANANRAREAMRVMEDHARFVLNDDALSTKLKALRHDLRSALELLPAGWIEANRDTPGDVGTSINTENEQVRQSENDVVIAAGKRLSESLRSLEEFGKIVSPEFGQQVESLRYRGYAIEQDGLQRMGAVGGCPQWKLCVLITESLCQLPWLDVVDAALRGGADCIQLREKNLPEGKLLGRAQAIVDRCQDAGAASIINDRPDIALMVGATGVHVGQTDLPVRHIRKIAGRSLVVGVSTSNLTQAEAAILSGADYIGVGPMFATTTKDKPTIAGPEYAKACIAKFDLPHLAIGGIDESNIATVVQSGVQGIAVSSAVCASDNPEQVVYSLICSQQLVQ